MKIKFKIKEYGDFKNFLIFHTFILYSDSYTHG